MELEVVENVKDSGRLEDEAERQSSTSPKEGLKISSLDCSRLEGLCSRMYV